MSGSSLPYALLALGLVQCAGCGEPPPREWRYLGENPPGMVPRVFGGGVVSTSEFEVGLSISPGGREILFTRHPQGSNQNRILQIKYEEGVWSAPALAPLAQDLRESHPNFSPDGRSVFFNSRRPLPGGAESDTPLNVWITRISGEAWGEPELLGAPVGRIRPMYVTATDSGTIYTTGTVDRGIYRATIQGSQYQPPERLSDEVNGLHWTGHPYVARDESYLLFDSNVDEGGTKHLFLSAHRSDGSWSQAVDVTAYLGLQSGSCPHVTFDGEYLFFSSNGDIYWVSARVLERVVEPKDT